MGALNPVDMLKDHKDVLLPLAGAVALIVFIGIYFGQGGDYFSGSNDISNLGNSEGGEYSEYPEMQIDQDIDYTATIKTNHGDIVVDLYEKDTPKAVNNFIFLAKENFYDGLLFHRVVENFVIQGGDPNGNGSGGPGYTFNDEILAKYTFSDNGVLAMANSGTNTNGSQFFITVTGSNPTYLNGKHTIFGKVISGMDVVDEISKVSTDSSDKPLSDVVIEDIVIHEN